ncbi:MAG TPA: hypothetical protein C5S50_01045 [Methanosarcinaceae archaeon]|nr:hypothetical protein [Methanosarcinaceae archaeon]
MKESIFDILGIGGREDSYTDLIAHSFKTSHEFNRNILANLFVDDYDDWIVKTRLPVAIKSNTGRKKDIPDMLLISKNGNSIVLIENKMFSAEGWEQTKRYASEEFKSSLIHYLYEKKLIETKEPHMFFFYLTLDGEKPASDEFKILKYSHISASIPDELGTSKGDLLLQELKDRIDEYYNWEVPGEDDVIIEYLNRAERLVSPHKAFYTMAENLNIDKRFNKDYYVTGNRGSAYIPACQWYKYPQWRGTNCKKTNTGTTCFEINIDFQ